MCVCVCDAEVAVNCEILRVELAVSGRHETLKAKDCLMQCDVW